MNNLQVLEICNAELMKNYSKGYEYIPKDVVETNWVSRAIQIKSHLGGISVKFRGVETIDFFNIHQIDYIFTK
jgi:hypothetical protein